MSKQKSPSKGSFGFGSAPRLAGPIKAPPSRSSVSSSENKHRPRSSSSKGHSPAPSTLPSIGPPGQQEGFAHLFQDDGKGNHADSPDVLQSRDPTPEEQYHFDESIVDPSMPTRCKICGTNYSTVKRLHHHVRFSTLHEINVRKQNEAVEAHAQEVIVAEKKKMDRLKNIKNEKIFHGTKLFWRVNKNADLTIYLNHVFFTVVAYDTEEDQVLPYLILDKQKIADYVSEISHHMEEESRKINQLIKSGSRDTTDDLAAGAGAAGAGAKHGAGGAGGGSVGASGMGIKRQGSHLSQASARAPSPAEDPLLAPSHEPGRGGSIRGSKSGATRRSFEDASLEAELKAVRANVAKGSKDSIARKSTPTLPPMAQSTAVVNAATLNGHDSKASSSAAAASAGGSGINGAVAGGGTFRDRCIQFIVDKLVWIKPEHQHQLQHQNGARLDAAPQARLTLHVAGIDDLDDLAADDDQSAKGSARGSSSGGGTRRGSGRPGSGPPTTKISCFELMMPHGFVFNLPGIGTTNVEFGPDGRISKQSTKLKRRSTTTMDDFMRKSVEADEELSRLGEALNRARHLSQLTEISIVAVEELMSKNFDERQSYQGRRGLLRFRKAARKVRFGIAVERTRRHLLSVGGGRFAEIAQERAPPSPYGPPEMFYYQFVDDGWYRQGGHDWVGPVE